MSNINALLSCLIEREDSVLVIIDVQDAFLAKLTAAVARRLTSRVAWLAHVAAALDIPIIVTAEDLPALGSVTQSIAARLPAGCPVYNKMVFNLAADPIILQAVEQTGRKSVILTGLETDVCVAHSALGLLARGYRVAAVSDATGSPGGAHQHGLRRMQAAGVLLTDVRSLFYEWVRTVADTGQLLERIERSALFPEAIIF